MSKNHGQQETAGAHPLAEDLDHVLHHVGDSWEVLRGARLFISGGTGFFGKWLLDSLWWANRCRALNARAVVLTRRPKSFLAQMPHLAQDSTIEFCEGDVRVFTFPPRSFTHVIHAATPTALVSPEGNPEALVETIVQGAQRVLEFARQAGARRFLLTSSGAVYGPQPADLSHIDERHAGAPDPLLPESSYGEAKRLAEHMGALYHHRFGMDVLIARGFAFVGPHLPLEGRYAIGNFIRDGLRGGPIRVIADGAPYRSYLYAADLAIWLWKILLRGQSCRPYNVGSETPISIAALAEKFAVFFGTKVQYVNPSAPGGAPPRYIPSTLRARRELEVEAWTDLDEAIRRTARFRRLTATSLVA